MPVTRYLPPTSVLLCMSLTAFCVSLSGSRLIVYDGAGFNFDTLPGPVFFCGPRAAPCAGTEPLPGYALVANYNSFSVATYGILKTYGTLYSSPGPFTSGPTLEDVFVRGGAGFDDTLTFLGPPTGTSGTFTPSFTISGSNPGLDSSYYLFAYAPSTAQRYYIWFNGGPYKPAIPITYGVPIEIEFAIGALVAIDPLDEGGFARPGYADTAVFSGITLLDQKGHPVPVHIVSESGTSYTSEGVTPEPSNFNLAILGLCSLGLFKWRWPQKRQQQVA